MNSYPLYPERRTRLLDGVWNFAWLGEDAPAVEKTKTESIVFDDFASVPGCFDASPQYAGKRGTAAYRTAVHLEEGESALLRTGGNGIRSAIFWDGLLAGIDELPYSAQNWQLPKGTGSDHELIIVVDNRFDFASSPLFNPFYDFYAYGGIYRSVMLDVLPVGPCFERAQVHTVDLKTGTVRVSVRMNGEVNKNEPLFAGFDGQKPVKVSASRTANSFTFETSLPDFKLWTPENPVLHTIELHCAGDTVIERFGMRTIECRGAQILLNGTPVSLRGVNRHDTHPQFGSALPAQLWLEDLHLLKDLGCNFIRGCHYPQSQAFLDLCDQTGFLVWEESLGWGDREVIQADVKFRRLQEEQTRLMVRNSINHPSVIMWGFMNEGGDKHETGESLYRQLATAVREEDASRPLTFASMYPETGRCFDLPDIISVNVYPGWYEGDNWTDERPLHRIAERLDQLVELFSKPAYEQKPLIVSEIGAGAIYGWRDRVQTLWSEEYQSAYLDEVCRAVDERKRINGLALWQFCDTRTYAAGGVLMRPRAFNNKGVVDEYRRPKQAYGTVKKRFKP